MANLTPVTREEMWLDDIANAVSGGGGGGGFTPTTEQLAAMNSGITAEDVTQIGTNETNISSIQGKTNHIVTDSSSKTYYMTPTTPQSPVDGDIWIY